MGFGSLSCRFVNFPWRLGWMNCHRLVGAAFVSTCCKPITYCWWFRNPANQLRWRVYHYLQGFEFCTCQVVVWDFWTINNVCLVVVNLCFGDRIPEMSQEILHSSSGRTNAWTNECVLADAQDECRGVSWEVFEQFGKWEVLIHCYLTCCNNYGTHDAVTMRNSNSGQSDVPWYLTIRMVVVATIYNTQHPAAYCLTSIIDT